MERPFRVPFSPVFPLIGIALGVLLTIDLPGTTWIRFLAWLAAGILIYVFYGYRHSRLRTESDVKTAGGGSQDTGTGAPTDSTERR